MNPSPTLTPKAQPERKLQKIALPGQTPQGEHIFGVLVKRTYDIVPGKRCVRAEADRKLIPGDVPYGDPMNTSIQFETDFIPFKLATDVVLVGRAHAPRGVATAALTASLSVGPARKDIRVTGDRVCRYQDRREPAFTDPQPFKTMEIRYELAYGGIDVFSDPQVPYPYPRNPLGRGFAVKNTKKVIDNLPLPNLEDPKDLLTPARLCLGEYTRWEQQPMPQGFGWFPICWRPRSTLAGVMPAERQLHEELRNAYGLAVPADQKALWEQTRLPDMDFRFFNGASAGLVLPYLSGDETVRTVNLTPEGETAFQLPGERPRMSIDFGTGVHEPPVVLHTVQVRMDDRQVDLVWRAAAPYPGPDWLKNMRKMEVLVV